MKNSMEMQCIKCCCVFFFSFSNHQLHINFLLKCIYAHITYLHAAIFYQCSTSVDTVIYYL